MGSSELPQPSPTTGGGVGGLVVLVVVVVAAAAVAVPGVGGCSSSRFSRI